MSTLHVSCAAEGRAYVAHSAAMLHSVLAHRGEHDLHVHYLCSPRLPAADRDLLAGMVERLGGAIEFVEIADERVADLPSTPQFTAAMWYRIFLPELAPDVDRVLYLDADTLAVDALAPLFEIDLTGHWLGAVTNVFQHNHLHRPAELGLAGPEVYFNSGVLLLNLAEMRRDGCTEALVRYASERGPALEWPDQDALNVVLGSRRLALHPRWNCMNGMYMFPAPGGEAGRRAIAEAIRSPGIRHFEGPDDMKPWHYLCAHDMRELYFAHRRETPWPSFEVEGATPRNRVRRLARRALSASRRSGPCSRSG